jgi:hypothetical protein
MPPMRSDSAPETRRLMIPQASMMDSICAPCADAKTKELKGEDRKKFMSECLSAK